MTIAETLQPAIAFLAAGLVAGVAARAIGVSVVVGYLIAGVLIGPFALGVVEENETTHILAELGVAFLLFDIGLHFSLKELRSSRKNMLSLAPAQILLCGAVFAGLARWAGCSWPVAAALGLSLALSSTAVVMRILADREKPGCPVGRAGTAVLVTQDVLAIFLLAFVGSLAASYDDLAMEMGRAAGLAFIGFVAALITGRFIVRPVFNLLARTRNEEAFTVLALLIVLAAGAATSMVGLSLTLGAFLAGMAIADTPYRNIIQTEVKPFRSLLLGLFFMSVGMSIDLSALKDAWPYIALVTAAIVIVKTVSTYAAARMNGWSVPGGTQLAFLLAQGSEFTLVIVAILGTAIPSPWRSTIVASVALSFIIAPFWFALGERLSRYLTKRRQETMPGTSITPRQAMGRVIVFGMTPAGRLAVDALRDFEIPYVALDLDPERFVAASSDGYDVVFGDSSDFRLMETVAGSNARAIVLGASRYDISVSLTDTVRERFPNLLRFVAAVNEADQLRHEKLGMKAHLSISEPYGVEMVTDLLQALDIPDEEITEWVREAAQRHGIETQDPEDEPDDEVVAA